MSYVDWHLQGLNVSTCNCAWGCPCQFMSLPTNGHCHAAVGIRIDRGHFGSVSLDGLAIGGVFAWPQAIHLGNGEAQPVVDVRASPAQREALLKIMSGQETEPGATIFNVFASTLAKVHDPLFAKISIRADRKARTATIAFEGIVDASVEPIRNPITSEPMQVSVTMPGGFEYDQAEFASSTVKTSGSPIALDWSGRHAHLADVDMTGKGVVHRRA
jgi:hypothetical protein